MKEYYEKVYIKSEADLPKEEGEYIVSNNRDNPIEFFFPDNPYDISHWNEDIDWYLQPVIPTLSREKVIDVLKRYQHIRYNEHKTAYGVWDIYYESIASELCDAGQREETISLERAKDFACYQYYRGSAGKPFGDFEDWEVKTNQREKPKDNFKNSPIHDKSAIIKLMDELYPEQMIRVVELLQELKKAY